MKKAEKQPFPLAGNHVFRLLMSILLLRVPLYLEKSNQIEDSLTAFKEFFEHVVIIGDLPPSATVNAYLKRMNQRKK